jgi:hypothetical protein
LLSAFVGFDISSVQFPSADTLPEGISLLVQDMREPFSAEFLGSFDIVHVKLLKYSFLKDEWRPVVENLVTLLSMFFLRPGS